MTETLSNHGGMCFACCQDYCRAAPPPPAKVELTAQEVNSPNAWAYRLRQREKMGDLLRSHQKAAWREVLKVEA